MINVSNIAKQKVETLMIEDGFNPSTDFIRVELKVVVVLVIIRTWFDKIEKKVINYLKITE